MSAAATNQGVPQFFGVHFDHNLARCAFDQVTSQSKCSLASDSSVVVHHRSSLESETIRKSIRWERRASSNRRRESRSDTSRNWVTLPLRRLLSTECTASYLPLSEPAPDHDSDSSCSFCWRDAEDSMHDAVGARSGAR